MTGKNLAPSAIVSSVVDRILVIENPRVDDSFCLPLFANGTPTLLFSSAKGVLANKSGSHLILFGQTILPDTITFGEGFTLIAYFFKPYSLLSIFKVAAQELTDKPVDLNLLSLKKINVLEEQLLHTACTAEKIALIDNYIAWLIRDSRNESAMIAYATKKIASGTPGGSLAALQKELHITERTFQRQFEKNIGITPNLYKRIYQFNKAFWQLNSGKFSKLSDIAFQNGYSDQSHYIRAFREFTNLTPGDYMNLGSHQ